MTRSSKLPRLPALGQSPASLGRMLPPCLHHAGVRKWKTHTGPGRLSAGSATEADIWPAGGGKSGESLGPPTAHFCGVTDPERQRFHLEEILAGARTAKPQLAALVEIRTRPAVPPSAGSKSKEKKRWLSQCHWSGSKCHPHLWAIILRDNEQYR